MLQERNHAVQHAARAAPSRSSTATAAAQDDHKATAPWDPHAARILAGRPQALRANNKDTQGTYTQITTK